MGIMVLNEGLDGWNQPKAADDYGNYFDEWWQKDMTDFITRPQPSLYHYVEYRQRSNGSYPRNPTQPGQPISPPGP